MFSCFDTIRECDRQAVIQTNSIAVAIHLACMLRVARQKRRSSSTVQMSDLREIVAVNPEVRHQSSCRFITAKSYSSPEASKLVNQRYIHRVSKKTKHNYFSYNFVKFSPTLTIFGTKMAKRLKLYEVHSFSTSPNSCHHTTV